jgi:hypothetical protein
MAELLPISSPLAAERQLDVVFVDGLGGDPIETWRSGTDENTSWPHWLALEFGTQIGVWSLGYAAAPSKWQGIRLFGGKDPDAGAAMSLPRRTENALDRLVGAGIGQRPVCFITHSLGGLLVKSILRRSADSQFAPERLQVVEQCRGVLFLATPHHGSRLADLAAAIKVYLPSVSTVDLKDNYDNLMDLYEWYRGYAPSHHILTRSYYENEKTMMKIVVPRSSADPGVSGPSAREPTPLDRNHLEISKPRNRQDQAYIGSTQLIRLILSGEAPESVPGQPVPNLLSNPPLQEPQPASTNQVKVSGNRNITMTGVSAGGNINVGNSIQGDYVAGDKFSGDKVMGDKFSGNKIIHIPGTEIIHFDPCVHPSAGAATVTGSPSRKPGPWRVFLSHTSELREFPSGSSYIAKAERGVIAAGHAIVDMADFAAIDQAPASVCIDKVKGSDEYIGIFGFRYGTPVRDQPEISYTELEFITATEAAIPRLIFLINADSEELGLPAKALVDRDYGDRQDGFIQRVKDAGLTPKFFRNPDDLKGLVESSLRELAELRGASTVLTKPATPEETEQTKQVNDFTQVHLLIPMAGDWPFCRVSICEERIMSSFTVKRVQFGCDPASATTTDGSSQIRIYIRSATTGEKTQILEGIAKLPKGQSLMDATTLLVESPSGGALDLIGVDLMQSGKLVQGLFVHLTLSSRSINNS